MSGFRATGPGAVITVVTGVTMSGFRETHYGDVHEVRNVRLSCNRPLATRVVMHTIISGSNNFLIISLNQIHISTVAYIAKTWVDDPCLFKAFKNKQNKQKTVGLVILQCLKIHW